MRPLRSVSAPTPMRPLSSAFEQTQMLHQTTACVANPMRPLRIGLEQDPTPLLSSPQACLRITIILAPPLCSIKLHHGTTASQGQAQCLRGIVRWR